MQPIEEYNPDGVDYAWVMQMTFILTIVIGAPLVTLLSLGHTLPTWEERVEFVVRVGACIWLLTTVIIFLFARSRSHDA